MPTFSQSLEQSLHRALAIANERHHQYATLEHLLLSLIDDFGCGGGDAGLQCRSRQAAHQSRQLSRDRIRKSGDRRRRRRQADRGLPARDPARGDPCPVVRSRGSDRRQCADRDLRRARKPRRLFPAGAGHDPLRRGQLYQPRHRQAARRLRSAAGSRRRRRDRDQGQRRFQEEGRGARDLLRQPQQESTRRQDRSGDRA